jgi:hypothetical protein
LRREAFTPITSPSIRNRAIFERGALRVGGVMRYVWAVRDKPGAVPDRREGIPDQRRNDQHSITVGTAKFTFVQSAPRGRAFPIIVQHHSYPSSWDDVALRLTPVADPTLK